jgi:hypothetical protein
MDDPNASGSVDPYMLNNWYPYLKPFTSETKFLTLSRETATAMLKACEKRRKKGTTTPQQEELLSELLNGALHVNFHHHLFIFIFYFFN